MRKSNKSRINLIQPLLPPSLVSHTHMLHQFHICIFGVFITSLARPFQLLFWVKGGKGEGTQHTCMCVWHVCVHVFVCCKWHVSSEPAMFCMWFRSFWLFLYLTRQLFALCADNSIRHIRCNHTNISRYSYDDVVGMQNRLIIFSYKQRFKEIHITQSTITYIGIPYQLGLKHLVTFFVKHVRSHFPFPLGKNHMHVMIFFI